MDACFKIVFSDKSYFHLSLQFCNYVIYFDFKNCLYTSVSEIGPSKPSLETTSSLSSIQDGMFSWSLLNLVSDSNLFSCGISIFNNIHFILSLSLTLSHFIWRISHNILLQLLVRECVSSQRLPKWLSWRQKTVIWNVPWMWVAFVFFSIQDGFNNFETNSKASWTDTCLIFKIIFFQ